MKNADKSIFPFKVNRTLETGQTVAAVKAYSAGLTKREYFIANAMQGLLSNPEWMKEYKGEKYLMQSEIVAEVAIKTADTILSKLSIEDGQ